MLTQENAHTCPKTAGNSFKQKRRPLAWEGLSSLASSSCSQLAEFEAQSGEGLYIAKPMTLCAWPNLEAVLLMSLTQLCSTAELTVSNPQSFPGPSPSRYLETKTLFKCRNFHMLTDQWKLFADSWLYYFEPRAKSSPLPVSANKILSKHVPLFMTTFMLPQQSWVEVTENIWPAKPKILIIWPFMEKVCWPLQYIWFL